MGRIFRKQVLVCTVDGEGRCAPKGGKETFQKFREEVKARGLDVLVTSLGCTGQHGCGPTVVVHPDGIWYKEVTAAVVPEIVEQHLVGGKVVEHLVNPERAVKAE
ncbi:MAG: ferredoxin [Lysobacteraceae bacterium]|nr:(2Fe-2S) ferredoxin domain-containing protein [Acidobacteriota bacterium]